VSVTRKETSYVTSAGTCGKEINPITGAVMSWRTRPWLGARSIQKLLQAPAALNCENAFQRYPDGFPSRERRMETRRVRALGFEADAEPTKLPPGTVKTFATMRPFLEKMRTTRSRAGSESVLISSAKRLGVLGRSRPIDQAPNVEIRCVTRPPE
jgi:hypothetical protein